MAETVLLVDDEPAIVKMLGIMLGAGGYEVVGAADATAAEGDVTIDVTATGKDLKKAETKVKGKVKK